MGTQHQIVVRSEKEEARNNPNFDPNKDSDILLSFYGHFDGYPTSAGADIAEFLREISDEAKLEFFFAELRRIVRVDDMEIPQEDRTKEKYPELYSDPGAALLLMILRGKQWYRDRRNHLNLPADVDPAAYERIECIEEYGVVDQIDYSYHIDLDKRTVLVISHGIGKGLFPHALLSFEEFKSLSMAALEMALSVNWEALSSRMVCNDLLSLCQSCAVGTAEGEDTVAFKNKWKSAHNEKQALSEYARWFPTPVKEYEEAVERSFQRWLLYRS